MRNKSNKYILFIIIAILLIGVAYLACKDITPAMQTLEKHVELKLSK